jgi:hypothetical protein
LRRSALPLAVNPEGTQRGAADWRNQSDCALQVCRPAPQKHCCLQCAVLILQANFGASD